MVVLLQELEIKALIDAALQDSKQFFKFCSVNYASSGFRGLLDNSLGVGLVFFFDNIESDLVCDQILVLLSGG